MSILYWTEQLKVNLREVDDQHKKMFDLANTFYTKLYEQSDETELIKSLTELISFSIRHFKYEEIIMNQHHFPQLEKHHNEHADFISELDKLKNHTTSGNLVLSVEIIEFLRNSIINHIFVSDREMAAYIIKNPID